MRFFPANSLLRIIAVGVMLSAIPAAAGEAPAADGALAAKDWREFTFDGIQPARFRAASGDTIDVASKDGASMLFRELSPSEREGRYVSWRWRVDTSVPATNLGQAGKDDRNLALHVWFPEGGEGGLFSALSRAFSKALGAPVTGKAISYIFGGLGKRGDSLANPFREGEAVYVILRPAGSELGQWFDEKVDIVGDFERAFGMPAPKPTHVAISTDSDDTDTESAGVISAIRFLAGGTVH